MTAMLLITTKLHTPLGGGGGGGGGGGEDVPLKHCVNHIHYLSHKDSRSSAFFFLYSMFGPFGDLYRNFRAPVRLQVKHYQWLPLGSAFCVCVCVCVCARKELRYIT